MSESIQQLKRIIEAASKEAEAASVEAQDVDLSEYGDASSPYDPEFHLTSRNDEIEDILGNQADLLEIDIEELSSEEAEVILNAGWYWYGDDGHAGDNARHAPEGYRLGSPELTKQLGGEIESWKDASIDNWWDMKEAEAQAERYQEWLQDGQ